MTLNGIDVSGFQPANIGELVAFDFLVAKATEGTGYVSGSCDAQVQSAFKRGKGAGVYHFADTGDATAQADFFCKNVQGYIGKAVFVLDWEGAAVAQGVGWVLTYLNRVLQQTGVRPVVYMSESVFHAYNWQPVIDAGFKLSWPAGYGSNDPTGYRNPGSISVPYFDAIMWQYGSQGRLPGYDGNLDIDIFFGDETQWAQLAAKGAAEPVIVTPPVVSTVGSRGATAQVPVNLTTYSWQAIQAKIGAAQDGIPGPQTLADLKAYQSAHGLVPDGIVGPATAHVMFANTGALTVDGVLGPNTIKALQSALGVASDGVMGPQTISALQRRVGVHADGVLGPVTREGLQKHLGVAADGVWGPLTISALQQRLNTGRF